MCAAGYSMRVAGVSRVESLNAAGRSLREAEVG